MLSYRHSFHAGNFADVIKHIVIIEILDYLIQKDKAFEYVDTHAGAGLFDLKSGHATKLNEYVNGIAKLKAKDWPELSRYFEVIKTYNSANTLSYYPGSPLIAMHFLRPQDRAWFFELHRHDYDLLTNNTGSNKRIKTMHEDGFTGLLPLLPFSSRRGLVLIDPSYEVKTDYKTVFKVISDAHGKFSTGTYALWYPVVERKKIDKLEKNFIHSGIKNIQRFELGLEADSNAKGMTASGMIVINPPWTLIKKMTRLLPKLVDTLGENDNAFFKCDILVGE